MTIHHHPTDETLLSHVAAKLRDGPALVIATHVSLCTVCRQRLRALQSIAGVLLEQMEPVAMSDGAMQRALAAVDAPTSPRPASRTSMSAGVGRRRALTKTSNKLGIELPSSLAHCAISPWRWLGPGVRWSKVKLPHETAPSVMLLRIAAGARLPSHTHRGVEFTQVLSGAFEDGRARFTAGDFDEANDEIDHQPVVDSLGECVCLAAIDGRMAFHGTLARGLGWLVGM